MREFASKDFFVDPDIRRAESLPGSAFTDPNFLEFEMETIFNKTWMLAPHHGSPSRSTAFGEFLNKPGSRAPFSLLGKPLFLQRSSRKKINCFPNVCTHAWHPLVESTSIGGSIVCPQHGREFDSEGRFMFHKGFEKLEGFPRESDNLRKLPLENWGPISTVCLGEPFAPFKKIAENVKESIPGIDLESFNYKPVPDEVREVDGNWKQHAWNYMDNYHIRFVHKGPGGLADAIDLETYTTELYQHSALQWAYARRPEDGLDSQQIANRFKDPNMTTIESSLSGGSSFPTWLSTSTRGAYQSTSTCQYQEDLTGPSFVGSNIHWIKRSSTKETRSGLTSKSTLRT